MGPFEGLGRAKLRLRSRETDQESVRFATSGRRVGCQRKGGVMKARLLILTGFLAVFLGAPCRMEAQAIGEILGTVRDPSGAVVPRAKITAVQTDTGLTRSTVSGAEGTFTLPQLPVGSY